MSNFVSDNVLERIRQVTDISSLIQGSVQLRKSGSGYMGLCPFHKEKTPSFHVNPEKQIFKCFGCGVGGDIFTFIMKTENCSFPEAMQILAERAHVELPTSSAPAQSNKARIFEVNSWAAGVFHKTLVTEPAGKKALEYLLKRGLKLETIKEFRIGLSQPGWRSLLDAAAKQKYSTELLLEAGLIIPQEKGNGYYDRFRNRIMFPIHDSQGRVIGFGGRALDDSEPKYLNSPETPLFSKGRTLYALDKAKDAFREKKQAVIVEGYMDAIMAHQFGVTWTVAVLGTALSQQHAQLLRRHVNEAMILFDSDNAGQSSAVRSIDAFAAEELSARVAVMPDGLDPDEYLVKYGEKQFLEELGKAEDSVNYKLSRSLKDNLSLNSAKAIDDVLATVALMPNPVAQELEIRKISERTGVQQMSLRKRIDALSSSRHFAEKEESAKPAAIDIEKRLLLTMLNSPEVVPIVQERLDLESLSSGSIVQLLRRTFDLAETKHQFTPADLLAQIQEEELRALVEGLIGQPGMNEPDPYASCHFLITEIQARAFDRRAEEMHRMTTTPPTTTAAPLAGYLDERLRAVREAHRARGTLEIKRGSQGGLS